MSKHTYTIFSLSLPPPLHIFRSAVESFMNKETISLMYTRCRYSHTSCTHIHTHCLSLSITSPTCILCIFLSHRWLPHRLGPLSPCLAHLGSLTRTTMYLLNLPLPSPCTHSLSYCLLVLHRDTLLGHTLLRFGPFSLNPYKNPTCLPLSSLLILHVPPFGFPYPFLLKISSSALLLPLLPPFSNKGRPTPAHVSPPFSVCVPLYIALLLYHLLCTAPLYRQ